MKSVFLFTMMFLSIVACQNEPKDQSNKSTKKQMEESTEMAAVQNLLFSYRDALNASDVNKVLVLYSKDGVFMPTNAPSAIGQEQIKGAYEYVFSQIQLNIEFFIDEIELIGDYAFARTTSKGTTLVHANGQTVEEENRELFILHKSDGQWKINRYMFNKMK